jgi:hypothetical protein
MDVYLAKGGNILEYKVKANTLVKSKNNCHLITLVLQPIQMFEHNHKKEKTSPLEIRDKVQKEFVVICKKMFQKT